MQDRQVLAAYDDSPASHAAIQWAATYAERSKRTLLIALAGDIPDPDDVAAAAIDESSSLVDAIVMELRSEHPDLSIETFVADEPPVQMIERLGDRCELTALGAGGGSRFRDAIRGSAAYRVAAHARCPVVLIPPDTMSWPPTHRPQQVVVGASASANGAGAVRFGVHYAAEVGGVVTIVRGIRNACGSSNDQIRQARAEQQQLLDDLADLGRRCQPDVAITTYLVGGSSEQVLRDASVGADLVVVGRHSSLKHLAGWTSLAARIAGRPPCPAAIVGDPTEPAIAMGT